MGSKGGNAVTMAPVIDVFQAFGLDLSTQAQLHFFELVCRLCTYQQENPTAEMGAGKVLIEQANEKGRFFKEYDQWMKRDIKALIDADELALAAFGVYPKKRTVCALAWSLAALIS